MLLAVISILCTLIFIPESPKWLYGMKKYSECQKSLRDMAKMNGRLSQLPNNSVLFRKMMDLDEIANGEKPDKESKEVITDAENNTNIINLTETSLRYSDISKLKVTKIEKTKE